MTAAWDTYIDNHKNYIRSYGEGEGSPNRETLFKYIPEGSCVLDVGMGPGCNYGHAKLINRKIAYTGIDYSMKFVEACRELFPEGCFFQGDARKLAFPDKCFDIVILQDVLEYTGGYEVAIEEAIRVAIHRVIICLWVPLTQGPTQICEVVDGINGSSYNESEFLAFLRGHCDLLTLDEEHRNRNHWYYILEL